MVRVWQDIHTRLAAGPPLPLSTADVAMTAPHFRIQRFESGPTSGNATPLSEAGAVVIGTSVAPSKAVMDAAQRPPLEVHMVSKTIKYEERQSSAIIADYKKYNKILMSESELRGSYYESYKHYFAGYRNRLLNIINQKEERSKYDWFPRPECATSLAKAFNYCLDAKIKIFENPSQMLEKLKHLLTALYDEHNLQKPIILAPFFPSWSAILNVVCETA